jgi:tryptophan halogenase
MTREFHQVRDFIILHYKATQRTDTDFWNYCREMSIPDSLQHKMDLFQTVGRVFRDDHELFTLPSWVAVMVGQNMLPETADPMLQNIPAKDIQHSLNSMNNAMQQTVAQMPTHAEFIQRYANAMA